MKIYPAIDLIDGKCVRLTKGDYDKKTIYSENPVEMAKSFYEQGSTYLHVVDLSGAKDTNLRQLKTIESIVKSTPMKVQVGGGIRSKQDAIDLKNTGVDRIIVGSLAVKNLEKTLEVAESIGKNHTVIGIDCFVNEGIHSKIAIDAWTKNSPDSISDLIGRYLQHEISNFLCTDINKDGMLLGPNFEIFKDLHTHFPTAKFILSGGIAELAHVKQAKQMNLDAMIIGKALYENRFTLKESFVC